MVIKKDAKDAGDPEVLDAGLEHLSKFLQRKREGLSKKEEASRRIRIAGIKTYQRVRRLTA